MAVKIPRDIASHIEGLRAEGRSNREIMEEALNPKGLFQDYADVNFDKFSVALVEGYEIKGTAEEEILKYYEKLKHEAWDYEEIDDNRLTDIANAKMDAVEFVLSELNVKISGIN